MAQKSGRFLPSPHDQAVGLAGSLGETGRESEGQQRDDTGYSGRPGRDQALADVPVNSRSNPWPQIMVDDRAIDFGDVIRFRNHQIHLIVSDQSLPVSMGTCSDTCVPATALDPSSPQTRSICRSKHLGLGNILVLSGSICHSSVHKSHERGQPGRLQRTENLVQCRFLVVSPSWLGGIPRDLFRHPRCPFSCRERRGRTSDRKSHVPQAGR